MPHVERDVIIGEVFKALLAFEELRFHAGLERPVGVGQVAEPQRDFALAPQGVVQFGAKQSFG
ncbi:MAG: hypothetical protein RBR77_07360 [Thauera sp.]|nr:hypothetical protein [Thauera sp.]